MPFSYTCRSTYVQVHDNSVSCSCYVMHPGLSAGEENLEKGREVAALSFIKKIQEVQGGQEAPHDGGAIIPKMPK